MVKIPNDVQDINEKYGKERKLSCKNFETKFLCCNGSFP